MVEVTEYFAHKNMHILDTCALTGEDLRLQFNDKKSQCVVFRSTHHYEHMPMLLLDKPFTVG